MTEKNHTPADIDLNKLADYFSKQQSEGSHDDVTGWNECVASIAGYLAQQSSHSTAAVVAAGLIVSTSVTDGAITVVVSVKQGDTMTVLYSRQHALNGESIGTAVFSAPPAPMCHAGLSQFANGEDAGQPAQAVDAASMLSGALNHARDALRFYAERQHFHMHQPDEWDTVSGEPQNFYEDSNNTATVEDGSVAKKALEDISLAGAYASAVSAHAQQAVEPTGWLYETSTGYRKFYKADETSSSSFIADTNAAKEYPEGHKMTPYFAVAPTDAAGKADAAIAGEVRAQEILDARDRLEQKWDSEGDCGSCGWHALLSEHDVSDDDIAYALDNGGWLELGCRSKDADDADTHRGVRIFIGQSPATSAADAKDAAVEVTPEMYRAAEEVLDQFHVIDHDNCGADNHRGIVAAIRAAIAASRKGDA